MLWHPRTVQFLQRAGDDYLSGEIQGVSVATQRGLGLLMTSFTVRSRVSVLTRKAVQEAWRFRLATIIVPVVVGCFILSVFSQVFQSIIFASLHIDGASYRSFTFAGCALAASMMAANTTGISMAVERQTGFSKRLRLMGCYRSAMGVRRVVDFIRIGMIGLVVLACGRLEGVASAGWWLTVPIVFFTCGLWGLAMVACVPKSSPELSQMVVPLFFPFVLVSSAFVPFGWLPSLLHPIAYANPVTYATDVVRASQAGQFAGTDLSIFVIVSLLIAFGGSFALRNIDT